MRRKTIEIACNESGFTMIEVLIATVMLTIGLLGGAALVTGIMTGNVQSERLSIATTLAQGKMENIRKLGYSGSPSPGTTSTEDYASLTGYPLYKRVTSYSSPGSNLKSVAVTVYWNSDGKSVSLQTLLANEG